MLKSSRLALCAVNLLLAGCKTISYPDLFPAHFMDDGLPLENAWEEIFQSAGVKPLQTAQPIPEDIRVALPTEFQLANEAGYLTCISDIAGKQRFIPILGSTNLSEPIHSDFFKALAKELSARNLKSWESVAYPDFMCFIPDIPQDEMFDYGWFQAFWVQYLTTWQDKEIENSTLTTSIQAITEQISSDAVLRDEIQRQIAAIDKSISDKRSAIADAEARLRALNARLGRGMMLLVDTNGLAEPPPFDLKIPYDAAHDPFGSVVGRYLTDISDKPWFNKTQSKGHYLDPELVDALDRLDAALKDLPQQDASFRQLVADTGFSKLSVVSATRTPWHQATEIAAAVKAGRKAAEYYKSNHMLGQGTDIVQTVLPNSPNYQKVIAILNRFGLTLPVKPSGGKIDPVHVELTTTSDAAKGRAIAMLRAYQQRAKEIAQSQATARENLIFIRTKLEEQRQKVLTDITARRAEREQKSTLFEQLSARYAELNVQIQQADAAIREREAAEQRRRDQMSRREGRMMDRDPRPDNDRPSPPRDVPRERPPRDFQRDGGPLYRG